MKLSTRFKRWLAGDEIAEVQARYEAALFYGNRTYMPGSVQSARQDIDSGSRQEIVRRTRIFEKNNALVAKILDTLEINVVGTGINPTPASSDPEWNKRALEWWDGWAQNADLTSRQDLYSLQRIGFRAQNVDGDHFIYLTEGETGRPRLQMVEAHRVSSYGDPRTWERQGYVVADGMLLDSRGRPQIYVVADEFDASRVIGVPVERMVHMVDYKRAAQYRGISIFHAAIAYIHDLDDLKKFEMMAAKDAASISKIIESAEGSEDMAGTQAGRALRAARGNGTPDNTRDEYYRTNFGAETRMLKQGDKYIEWATKRPSAAMQWFWEDIAHMACQSAGISFASVSDYKNVGQGTALRAVITSDNRSYELHTKTQARHWHRVWQYAIGWAADHGEVPALPKDWLNVRWHPPRRASVDSGRDIIGQIAEIKAGTKTYEGTYGESGEDWKERLEQRAKEEQWINQLADKYQVEREDIASLDANERAMAGQQNGDNGNGGGGTPAGDKNAKP